MNLLGSFDSRIFRFVIQIFEWSTVTILSEILNENVIEKLTVFYCIEECKKLSELFLDNGDKFKTIKTPE